MKAYYERGLSSFNNKGSLYENLSKNKEALLDYDKAI